MLHALKSNTLSSSSYKNLYAVEFVKLSKTVSRFSKHSRKTIEWRSAKRGRCRFPPGSSQSLHLPRIGKLIPEEVLDIPTKSPWCACISLTNNNLHTRPGRASVRTIVQYFLFIFCSPDAHTHRSASHSCAELFAEKAGERWPLPAHRGTYKTASVRG